MAAFFADAGAVRGEPDLVNTAGTIFGERAEAAEEAEAPIAPPEPPSGDASKKRGGFLAPLRIANFRWLVAGQTISRLGDQFYFVAIPWLVLRVSDSPASLALVTGASAAALGIFTLVGGVLADRFGPRTLMLGSDVGRLIVIGVLGALAIISTPPLWLLIALSALLGIGGGLFYPASAAMIPFLVPPDDLQAGNSFDQMTNQIGNFLGPGIAGAILGATRLAFGFVVDAITFAVSVFSLAFIRVPKHEASHRQADTAAEKPKGGVKSLFEAFRYLYATPFLFTMVLLSLLANFAVNGLFEVALPLLLKQWVGIANGPQALGIVISGFGFGSVVGAVTAGVAARLRRKSAIAVFCLLPVGVLVGIAPFLGSAIALAAAFAVIGVLIGLSNVLFITVMQRFIPMEMMGRMMSIMFLGSFVGTPLSIAAYGAAASFVPNISWLFLAGGALFAVAGVIALTRKVVWASE